MTKYKIENNSSLCRGSSTPEQDSHYKKQLILQDSVLHKIPRQVVMI